MGALGRKGPGLPYEPMLHGSVVVCLRCRDDDPSRSPLFPSWFMPRHDAWHTGQERDLVAQYDDPALAS